MVRSGLAGLGKAWSGEVLFDLLVPFARLEKRRHVGIGEEHPARRRRVNDRIIRRAGSKRAIGMKLIEANLGDLPPILRRLPLELKRVAPVTLWLTPASG